MRAKKIIFSGIMITISMLFLVVAAGQPNRQMQD